MADPKDAPGADQQRKPLKNLELRIMCVGDSITTGCEPFENGYRKDLLDSLDPSNVIEYIGPHSWGSMKPESQNKIDAWMGRTIKQTSMALQTTLPEYKPDVILLHTGTNDLAGGETWDHAIISQVDELLHFIQTTLPTCTVLIARIIPAAFRGPQINDFNHQVLHKVDAKAREGMKVESVDLFTDWPDGTLRDLAHPNGEGYVEIAKRFGEGLERVNAKGWLSGGQ